MRLVLKKEVAPATQFPWFESDGSTLFVHVSTTKVVRIAPNELEQLGRLRDRRRQGNRHVRRSLARQERDVERRVGVPIAALYSRLK